MSQSPKKDAWKELHTPLKLLINFEVDQNEAEMVRREAKLEVSVALVEQNDENLRDFKFMQSLSLYNMRILNWGKILIDGSSVN